MIVSVAKERPYDQGCVADSLEPSGVSGVLSFNHVTLASGLLTISHVKVTVLDSSVVMGAGAALIFGGSDSKCSFRCQDI